MSTMSPTVGFARSSCFKLGGAADTHSRMRSSSPGFATSAQNHTSLTGPEDCERYPGAEVGGLRARACFCGLAPHPEACCSSIPCGRGEDPVRK